MKWCSQDALKNGLHGNQDWPMDMPISPTQGVCWYMCACGSVKMLISIEFFDLIGNDICDLEAPGVGGKSSHKCVLSGM